MIPKLLWPYYGAAQSCRDGRTDGTVRRSLAETGPDPPTGHYRTTAHRAPWQVKVGMWRVNDPMILNDKMPDGGLVEDLDVTIDNVLISMIDGMPVIEQASNSLSVGLIVGTSNLVDVNGIDVTCTGTWGANFSLAFGTDAMDANILEVINTEDYGSQMIDPGTLFPLPPNGNPRVVITYVNPGLAAAFSLKQGEMNNGIQLAVSLESDSNYASISGTDLWDPLVFGNSYQRGNGTKVPATRDLIAVSNYGINSSATSTWPLMSVDLDLSDYGCPSSRYLCVQPRRNASSMSVFSLQFIPQSAMYGCVSMECLGVEFVSGVLSPENSVAEYARSHEVTLSVAFQSDSTKGSIRGTNLWKLRVFASSAADGGVVLSQNYSALSGADTNAAVEAGNSLTFSQVSAVLDLSAHNCSSLLYLCAAVEKHDSPSIDFDMVAPGPVCALVQCDGVILSSVTIAPSQDIDPRFPVKELVGRVGVNFVYVDVTLQAAATSGSVSGDNLWEVTVFLSNTSSCDSRILSATTGVPNPNIDLSAGETIVLRDVEVRLDMSNTVCNQAPYMCVDIATSSSFAPVSGMTQGSFDYPCTGVEISNLNLLPTIPDPVEITEREDVSFTVNVVLTAASTGGSAIGDDLWNIAMYFSSSGDGSTMVVSENAAMGAWANEDLTSGQSATLTSVMATIQLDSTCEELLYLCVRLSKQASSSVDFILDPDSVLVDCVSVAACRGVNISETNAAVAGSGSLNVVENTDTAIDTELELTGRSSADSASISGTDLWSLQVFTSSNEMGSTKDRLLPDHRFSARQAGTPIASNSPFAFTNATTSDVINVAFNMSGVTCEMSSYLCLEILKNSGANPDFTLVGNTVGCVSLNCKGVIVTEAGLSITQIPNGNVLIEGFPDQVVDILFNVTTNSTGADALGAGLWQLHVFTNAFANGSGTVRQFETTLTGEDWADTNITAGSMVSLPVEVNVDLSSSLCAEVKYLCVELQKGASPSRDFTLMYQTSQADLVDCVPVTCETAGISRNGMSFTPERIVEHQMTPEPFTVSVSYKSEPGRDNITGTNLWALRAYLSDSVNGTTILSQSEVQLGDLANAPFYSGSTLNFTNLPVNISLMDVVCPEDAFFCTQLEKGDPQNTEYSLEILPECLPIQCAGVILNSTMVTVDSANLREFETDQPVVLSLMLNTVEDGASVSGMDLWDFNIFLSSSDTMFDNRLAVEMVSLSAPNNEHTVVAGTPLDVSGLDGALDLADVGCVQFSYICVEVYRAANASQNFTLELLQPGSNIGCAPINCRGVVMTDVALNLTDGEPVLERATSQDVSFDVTLMFDDDSAQFSGSDFWQLDVFTNTDRDGRGDSCAMHDPLFLDGNITRGQSVMLAPQMLSLNLSQCTCPEMPFLCVVVKKNPQASRNFTLDIAPDGFTACEPIDCTGVRIQSVDLSLQPGFILFEAQDRPESFYADVSLMVDPQSAGISGATDVWALEFFLASRPEDYNEQATLTEMQRNQGVSNVTIEFRNLTVALGTFNYICPPSGTERLCVRASRSNSISPADIDISFVNDTSCVVIVCQGVDLTNLTVNVEDDSAFVEFEATRAIVFDITANVTDSSTTITSGANLWSVLVYAALYENGTGERFSESQIPLNDLSASVTPRELVTYNNVTWNLDLSNFVCPDSNTFYMCVELSANANSTPRFSLSDPLLTCTEIDCLGVVITLLNLTVVSGDPVLERTPNDVILSVTATSSAAGSSIVGSGLWSLDILVCEFDQCSSGSSRRRKRTTGYYDQVTANLTSAEANADLPAGSSISFNNIALTLDLTTLTVCPESEIVYICVQLEQGDSPSRDFKLSGDLLACQPVNCEGVHIASGVVDSSTGTLQEGNPSNAVLLRLTFTADVESASVSGTNLWDIEVFGSRSDQPGETEVGLVVADIGSTTNVPLAPGGSIQFQAAATLDLSVPSYRTCDEVRYVCGRLTRNPASSETFSVTGSQRTACAPFQCTGVLLSDTNVTVVSGNPLTEGESNELTLTVTLDVTDESSDLVNVTDAWTVEVYGNAQSDGNSLDGTGRFVANTSQVGEEGASPGMVTTLNPVSVTLDLSNEVCGDVNYVCVQVQRGVSAAPAFRLQGVPADFDGLYACAEVDCIGVRIYNGTISAVTMGDPLLKGNADFNIQVDVQYVSHDSGAGIMGTDSFGLKMFLASYMNGTGVIGEKLDATIPAGSQSTQLQAGAQLDLSPANISIDTSSIEIPAGSLYICTELFRPDSSSLAYKLSGYDAALGIEDDSFLIACREVECRGVRIDDIMLSFADTPINILERTADQTLSLNVSVQPAAAWGSVKGTDLWELEVSLRNGSTTLWSGPVTLSSENQNLAVTAGEEATFPDVQLSLDLPNFDCPSDTVDLCLTISAQDNAMPSFSLDPSSVLMKCEEVACRVTEIVESSFVVLFPANIIEYEENPVRLDVSLTAGDVSAAISGSDLWKIERVFVSSSEDGSGGLGADLDVPLIAGQGDTGISAGETVVLASVQAELPLDDVPCSSMPYLCVEVAKGDNPMPSFQVNFINDSNIICQPNDGCRGIVITSTSTSIGSDLSVDERDPAVDLDFNITVVHDSNFGTDTGNETRPWQVTVSFNDQSDCRGDNFNSTTEGVLPDTSQMLVDGHYLILEVLASGIDLSELICEDEYIYMCVEFAKNESSPSDFSIMFDPSTAGLVTEMVRCRGVEVTGVDFVLLSDPEHDQYDQNYEARYSFSANFSAESAALSSASPLWSLEIFGSRSEVGRGAREDFPTVMGDFANNASVVPGDTVEIAVNVTNSLSFVGVKCADMPYLCVELKRASFPSTPLFSLMGIPDDDILIDCEPLDCQGVEIDEFNVSVTTDGDPIVLENNNNFFSGVNLSLNSQADGLGVTGTDIWEIWVFFNSDPSGFDAELIAETQVTPLPPTQADQHLSPGGEISFGPLTVNVNLNHTCDGVMYMCFELRDNPNAVVNPRPILLGNTRSCVPVTCQGVVVQSTFIAIQSSTRFIEATEPIDFEVQASIIPATSSADISGTSLWKLQFYFADSVNGSAQYSAPAIYESLPLSVGSVLRFDDLRPVFNASEVICSDAIYLCLELMKSNAAVPDFTLSGAEEDSLVGCQEVDCRGVEVASSNLNIPISKPVLVSNDPAFEVGTVAFVPTFSVMSREIDTGPNGLSVLFFVAADDTNPMATPPPTRERSYAVDVVRGGSVNLAVVPLVLNFQGVTCDQMQFVCGTLMRGSATDPSFTLSAVGDDESLFTACEPYDCVGVTVNNLAVTINSGVPLLEDAPSHEVNFTLRVSSAAGGDAVGDGLWRVRAFLSPYENGSDPISVTTADIGGDADLELPADRNIDIAASVNLNASNFVCTGGSVFLCVQLLKGNAPTPDFTLEGAPGLEDLQECQEFSCEGVSMENPAIAFSPDLYLLEFNNGSDIMVNVSVDIPADSASVSGTDLWYFEFFTSSDSSGNTETSPRTTAEGLTPEQGSVSIVAGETSLINDISASLSLAQTSCAEAAYLCVEVWKGQRASPFYTINSPDSPTDLRACSPVTCVGVKLLEVIPEVKIPPILIENNTNQNVTLSIVLIPDPTMAGVEGNDLFEVDIFASSSNTGMDPPIGMATVEVSNAQNVGNGVIDPNQNTTLISVVAQLNLGGYSCSELQYVCVRVREGPNRNPAFTFEPSSDLVGCSPVRCGGVVVTSVVPSIGSNDVLEGDDAHELSVSVKVTTGTDGITTPGDMAWQLEVFVSKYGNGSGERYGNVTLSGLTAPAAPAAPDTDNPIRFNEDIIMDLNVSCDVVNYLCVELSAPSADFTLVGFSQDEIPVECVQTMLRCQGIGEPITIEGMTDTTLTVSWPESIGDFDSYGLSVDPSNTNAHTQLKSDAVRTHTFTNLIPGESYTVRLELLKSSDVKGETFYSNVVLYLACPDVKVTNVTSREIEIAWYRPSGATNVNEYSVAISPKSGGTVHPPFTEDGSNKYTYTFDTLTPAETYEITVTASGDNGIRSDSCDPVTQATDPGRVELTVNSIGTVTADLSWTVTFADVLSGFRLAANVRTPTTGDDPAPVYISSSDRSHTLTGLLPGTEYQFVVEAFVNSSGTLNFGKGGTDIARTTPLPPNNIMIELQSTSIEVSYTAPEGFHTNFSFSVHNSNDVLLQGPEVTDNFMVTFDNLDPGTGYTLYSKTISGDKESTPTATEFTTRPSKPGPISTQEVTSTSITITWEHSARPRSHYEVSYSPNSTFYIPSPPPIIENRFTLSGLEPYLTVDFSVRAVVNSVASEPSEWRQRTYSSRSDPPEELMLVMTSPSSVNVLFRIPSSPNGLITSYVISFDGTRNVSTISLVLAALCRTLAPNETYSGTQVVPAGPNDVEFEEPIANLNPGATYVFEVVANNEAGSSEPTSERIDLIAGDPEPSGNDIDDNNSPAITSSTISVVIDENLFSDVNGDITGFQVFVVEDGGVFLDRTIDDPPLRYQIVVLLPQRLPYVTSNVFAPAPITGRRKRQIAGTRTRFTIGTESPCPDEESICNGPLEPLTAYRVLVRAYTDGGYADSPWSDPIVTSSDRSWFEIPVIIYGVIIGITLFILILLCCSAGRHRSKRVRSTPGPRVRNVYGTNKYNANQNNSSRKPAKSSQVPGGLLSRPILTEQFHKHYNMMIANKQDMFTREFESLHTIGKDQPRSEGRLPNNKGKNRFGNILPYNSTRVPLSGKENYINASFITGFNGAKEYIATQSPMSHTVHDFWKMIWEEKAACIVMLVKCIEGGKEKCDKYWPTTEDPTVYGSVIVTKLDEHIQNHWVIRDFRLKVGSEVRILRQYNFTAWPTRGTPRDTHAFRSFVHNIREVMKPPRNTGPMVVHCSAGIGRTGVFIGLDILMQELKADQRTVDVVAVVSRMRKERLDMVQLLVHYIFLHRTLADAIQAQGWTEETSRLEQADSGSTQSDEVISDMSNTSL
ncbi:uncharacterized protein [Diadema setosum]|uniref:uncharacterized protein n=1 Tax=Diadema setosum TaxID=31175 RepID=UPI003B3BC954